MGDVKFLLGFFAGWIATTDDGKKFANQIADVAIAMGKVYLAKNTPAKPLEDEKTAE